MVKYLSKLTPQSTESIHIVYDRSGTTTPPLDKRRYLKSGTFFSVLYDHIKHEVFCKM